MSPARRPDGYHELQTLFQLIDLADDIHIQVRPDAVIERQAGPPGVPAEADLVVRAARALQAAAGIRLGASLSSPSAFRWAAAWAVAVRMPRRCWWR